MAVACQHRITDHCTGAMIKRPSAIRMKFKTVWLWPLIDTLNSSIDWDNLGERLYVTTTVHDVPTIDI